MAFLLQWSEEEHQFDIQETKPAMESNIQDFLQGLENDYVTLAILDSDADASRLSRELATKRGLRWSDGKLRWVEPNEN